LIPGGLLDLLGDRLPQIHDDRLLAASIASKYCR
jgi:hypothetical protein